jgi:iron(III) transport system permease protein
LIIPTLIIFLVQRYYVNRKSYISVTGKPAGSQIVEKDPFIRWTVNIIVYLVIAFIILLYATIIYGSFSAAWGVDFTPTLRHWEMTVTRGIEAILDTTFLSALATPFAALIGMVIAWLVVRKKFTGKDVLDFSSNLGGAVPGTILGIGFILAFNKPPLALAVVIYAVLALFFAQVVGKKPLERILILVFGTAAGVGITLVDEWTMYTILGGIYLALAVIVFIAQRKLWRSIIVALLGVYVMSYNWANAIAKPIANFSRSMERGFWSNAIFQVSDHIKVLVQPTPALLAVAMVLAGIILFQNFKGKGLRIALGILGLAVPCALSFTGIPFAMVGSAYIIMAAFIVRSVPASVRSGVAALQQIDPSIEEASNILGADAQYTFRKVTLPLILPALFAGLIFSFTRHMTSVSAIIFLVSAKWRIVTASILSEWEQGGVSIAAAYSTVIIVFVMIAILVLNLLMNKLFKGRGSVDMSQGF